MVQAIGRRQAIAEVRVRAYTSQCGIYGGQSGIGKGIPPSTPAFAGHDYPISDPYLFYHPSYIISATNSVIK
jgi:hypothetical protein